MLGIAMVLEAFTTNEKEYEIRLSFAGLSVDLSWRSN
jgi:hypothetical protein